VTLLYSDPRFLDHDTGDHPERAARLRQITEKLSEAGLDPRCEPGQVEPVSLDRLHRLHLPEYVELVRRFAAQGGGFIEADTVVSSASYDVALLAAGAACDAVERVLSGQDTQALCLVRPPGHHALRHSAMGFCLFNNVALAARVAIDERQLDRVLIVDWDVHHGNGTQDAFWEDEQVGFFSIHRYPFYPGTGGEDETGAGAGAGATMNVPVAFGTPRPRYIELFRSRLKDFAAHVRPQLVLISAGFDSHRADPIGSLGLEVEDFATLTDIVLDVADAYASGRVVSLLEGGYNVVALADSVAIHLETMLARQAKKNP
jgi:acetoin utilization deacetylase AcuC-like enzyme